MKRFTLLLAALIGLVVQANAQYGEELVLGSKAGWGWSKKTIIISDQEIPQLPATVSIPGNWGDVKLWTGSFDSQTYTGFKVVLREAPATGTVQLYYRNAAQASAYSGTYLTWESDEAGVNYLEDGKVLSGVFSAEALGDDLVITEFALQNRTSDAVSVIVEQVYLIDAEGKEVPTNGLKATGWNPASITPLTVPEDGVQADVYEFTNQYGEMGVEFGEVQEVEADKPHIFKLVSPEAIPAGEFQWKVYNEDESNSYIPFTIDPENEVTLQLTTNYTGLSIQHTASTASTLPQSIKLYRQIVGGPISKERLPIVVGSNGSAQLIDPAPSMEQGENGLPVGVEISGSYGAVGLWKEAFEVGEYVGYKVVLAEKPADGTVQIFFRTETHGNSGGLYLPWETNEANGTVLSEDGTTLTGEFDMDAFEGDNTVLVFAIQRIAETGTVRAIVKEVCLMNEDEEWVQTPGIGYAASSLWNEGSTFPVGGSYDENGNIWDAYVQYNAVNDYMGTYSGTVEDGTYHKVTFYTEEPLPEGVVVSCMNIGLDWNTWQWTFDNVESKVSGQGTNALSVIIPRSYNSLYVGYYGAEENLPVKVRFTKVVREVYELTPDAYFYGIAGDFNNWSNDLLLTQSTEDPNIYTATLSGQQVKEMKAYGYKVRSNRQWGFYELPAAGEGNMEWTPETPGIYDFTFTFNLAENTCTLNAVRTDDITWTCTYVNVEGWESVYAYTWSANGAEQQMGAWPGTQLQANGKQVDGFDVYAFSYKATYAPENIIFNNGQGGDANQTEDLVFEDGKQYNDPSKQTVVGITDVRSNESANRYFDLQGRRVAQPAKGLYIVNGKKVVLK